jgi:hypothetical protein
MDLSMNSCGQGNHLMANFLRRLEISASNTMIGLAFECLLADRERVVAYHSPKNDLGFMEATISIMHVIITFCGEIS